MKSDQIVMKKKKSSVEHRKHSPQSLELLLTPLPLRHEASEMWLPALCLAGD